jgi:hypothetical protein
MADNPIRPRMPWRLAAIASCLILSGCAIRGRGLEDMQIKGVIDADDKTQTVQSFEPHVLAAAQDRAWRRNDSLFLAITAGPPVELVNLPDCDDTSEKDCRSFYLAADLASRHSFLVEETFFNGSRFLLIDDRSGRKTELDGPPQFGPDDSTILVIDNDETFVKPSVQVWQRSGDAFVRVFSHDNAVGVSASLEAWDADGIHLALSSADAFDEDGRHWTGTITRNGAAWHFDESAAPAQ